MTSPAAQAGEGAAIDAAAGALGRPGADGAAGLPAAPASGTPAGGQAAPSSLSGGASTADGAEAYRQVVAIVARDGGELAAVLRRFQTLALPDGGLDEGWRWLAYVRVSRGLSSSTAARYLEVLGRFLVYVAGKGLDFRTLTAADIDAWQRHLAFARHNAEIWRATQLMALRNFYGWRSRFGRGVNACEGVQAPKFTRRRRRKYTRKDLAAMFATCTGADPLSKRDRAMLLFLLATGARRDECAALRLDQLDLTDRRGVVRFLGKGRKERTVGFEGPIVDILREWLLLRDNLPKTNAHRVWISLSSSGKGRPLTMNGVEHAVTRAAKRAGLAAWGVHRFRVTYATWLYDDGHDMETIARLLGHNDINTTRAYLDVSDRAQQVRLRPDRQHDLLGSKPLMPRWLDKKLTTPTTANGAPF